MADILVCIKRVPDVSGEVLLTDDGQHVDARHVGYTVSPHELCAVELAVQVAGDTGGSVTVVTLGTDESVDKLRDAVAVGATGAILVEVDDPDAFGPRDVASALAEVVQSGSYDLVLCNPPNIAEAAPLMRDVACFEPASALYSGPDGLDDHRRISHLIGQWIAPGGIGCVEIGEDQAEVATALYAETGLQVVLRSDLAGRPRCLILGPM